MFEVSNDKLRQRIIKEIVDEKKKDPKVVSILLFGSMARGTHTESSDIDIEIIYDEGTKRIEVKEKRHGIDVDFEIWPKDKFIERIEKYPFLSYPYMEEKILFDPTGIVKEFKMKLKKYFEEHEEILKIWEKWKKVYLENKKYGKKQKSVKEFYDDLEIRFSKDHIVTRNF